MVLHRFWDATYLRPPSDNCASLVVYVCMVGRYVCKKTNGFELINLGKFDFSAGQHVEFSQQQQCHGIESRLVVPAALLAENRAQRHTVAACPLREQRKLRQNAHGIGLTTFGP